ncbi:hypothetical protein [Thermovirga sp.]|uniref:hypothetical protein n=1 Tax=Thermovirga sp. TaxID=2699834 RepID=UPI0025E3838E|nr:hypothetical protein [Thermovirga sp.]MBO8153516.1 hypothetical protein [Thermovirga sp.]
MLWSKLKKGRNQEDLSWDVSSELMSFKEQLEARYEEEKALLEKQKREAEGKFKLMSEETIKKSLDEWSAFENKLEREIRLYRDKAKAEIEAAIAKIDRETLIEEVKSVVFDKVMGNESEVAT